MEDDGIRTYKKGKIGTDSEDLVVLRPKKNGLLRWVITLILKTHSAHVGCSDWCQCN